MATFNNDDPSRSIHIPPPNMDAIEAAVGKLEVVDKGGCECEGEAVREVKRLRREVEGLKRARERRDMGEEALVESLKEMNEDLESVNEMLARYLERLMEGCSEWGVEEGESEDEEMKCEESNHLWKGDSDSGEEEEEEEMKEAD